LCLLSGRIVSPGALVLLIAGECVMSNRNARPGGGDLNRIRSGHHSDLC